MIAFVRRDPLRSRLLVGLTAAAVLIVLAAVAVAIAVTRQQATSLPPVTPGRTVAASARCPRSSAVRTGPLRPVLAVIGASFSAGIGAEGADTAWPADLGRLMRLRVEVSAVPGAGFITLGRGRRGPFAALATRLDLARLRPVAVLIQGGHNDIGQPSGLLGRSVRGLVNSIRCSTPGSRIGVVSVFPTGDTPSRTARLTDRTIVTAARAADPRVVVFDPIGQAWHYPRVRDQLHPTTAGHRYIAEKIFAGLRAAGVPTGSAVTPKPSASA